jgi:hypothetical protein
VRRINASGEAGWDRRAKMLHMRFEIGILILR